MHDRVLVMVAMTAMSKGVRIDGSHTGNAIRRRQKQTLLSYLCWHARGWFQHLAMAMSHEAQTHKLSRWGLSGPCLSTRDGSHARKVQANRCEILKAWIPNRGGLGVRVWRLRVFHAEPSKNPKPGWGEIPWWSDPSCPQPLIASPSMREWPPSLEKHSCGTKQDPHL